MLEQASPPPPPQSCNPATDCCIQSISPLNLKCNLEANNELPKISQGTTASGLGSSPGLFCSRKEGSRDLVLIYLLLLQQATQSPCETSIPNTPGQPHQPGTCLGSPHLCHFQHMSIHVNAALAPPWLFSWGLISGTTGSKTILAQALCTSTEKDPHLVQKPTELPLTHILSLKSSSPDIPGKNREWIPRRIGVPESLASF